MVLEHYKEKGATKQDLERLEKKLGNKVLFHGNAPDCYRPDRNCEKYKEKPGISDELIRARLANI